VKKTELDKLKGLKIAGRMNQVAAPGRFGKDAAVALDRREQRRRDQALGLVPFAVKLDSELVRRIQALAQTRGATLNDVVMELLEKGLGDH
jgi:hypothetical protein